MRAIPRSIPGLAKIFFLLFTYSVKNEVFRSFFLGYVRTLASTCEAIVVRIKILPKTIFIKCTYILSMILDMSIYLRAVRASLSSTESYCSKAS